MKIYDIIDTCGGSNQTHSVVAENIGEAERIYLGKYRNNTIKEIRLHSVYVQIQKYDEQREEISYK